MQLGWCTSPGRASACQQNFRRINDENWQRRGSDDAPAHRAATVLSREAAAYHTHRPTGGGPAKYLNLPTIDTAGAQRAKWIDGHLRHPKRSISKQQAAPRGARPTDDTDVESWPPVPPTMGGGRLYDAVCSQAAADALAAELEASVARGMGKLGGGTDGGAEHARCDAWPRALLLMIGGEALAEWALGARPPEGWREEGRVAGWADDEPTGGEAEGVLGLHEASARALPRGRS